MQMHKSFILDSALAKESTQTILFPWKYQAIENTKEYLMPFYLHTQKRHLIICSKAEERHVLMSLYWMTLRVCLFVCVFAGAWRKSGNPVRFCSQESIPCQHLYTLRVNKSTVWWEQNRRGWWLPPTEFKFGFHIERAFTTGSAKHTWIHASFFPVPAHGSLWISVPLLNRKTAWVKWLRWCHFCVVNEEYMCCRFA